MRGTQHLIRSRHCMLRRNISKLLIIFPTSNRRSYPTKIPHFLDACWGLTPRAASLICATGGFGTRLLPSSTASLGTSLCLFPWILPLYFFAQDLVVMSCMFPWMLPPYFFAQDPPLFPRIGIRLESNPDDRVFYVHEFVLHSSSKFYEGLVGFYAEQPQQGGPAANGRASAQITIPAECLTDARCALPVWNCAASMPQSFWSCTRTPCSLLKHETLVRVLEASVLFMYTHVMPFTDT